MIEKWSVPGADDPNIRVDTHVSTGYEVPVYYDSLLCKVITKGETRDEACDRMIDVLENMVCDGVSTTVPMHLQILRDDSFRSHNYNTGKIPGFKE